MSDEEEPFPSFLKKKVKAKCVDEITAQLTEGERVLHVEEPLFWQGERARL